MAAQSILCDDAKAAQLSQLLGALQDSNNVQRAQAEETLNNQWVEAQPDALFVGLAEQVQRCSDPSVRFDGCELTIVLVVTDYLADPVFRRSTIPPHVKSA